MAEMRTRLIVLKRITNSNNNVGQSDRAVCGTSLGRANPETRAMDVCVCVAKPILSLFLYLSMNLTCVRKILHRILKAN
jgi:hypothetical protein